MVVHKFPVAMPNSNGRSFVDLPSDAVLLSVGLEKSDRMVVWALTDPDREPKEGMDPAGPHRLIVANTGMDVPGFPEGARFLGTVKSSNGVIWHVWDGDAETTA